jgi:hypothetical protein
MTTGKMSSVGFMFVALAQRMEALTSIAIGTGAL